MTIAEFDHLSEEKKTELLLQCCGSAAWVSKMLTVFPVEDLVELLDAAEEKWYECNEDEWKQAFEHHPKIGDINSLKEKFSDTKAWATNEQSGIDDANEKVLADLSVGNTTYQDKFGYIFIVCATGKSADEMLALFKERINNSPEKEVQISAAEQLKITRLRLEKLFY